MHQSNVGSLENFCLLFMLSVNQSAGRIGEEESPSKVTLSPENCSKKSRTLFLFGFIYVISEVYMHRTKQKSLFKDLHQADRAIFFANAMAQAS